ncbi:MAG: hypothetical protein KAH38_12230, partial [Candidatus Hydrogenedentes bacterium]|nr:hypothetical protein [Candidatus Hydrogenedentota bacterium]
KTSGDREGIPAEYATQLLAVINALNNMEQSDISHMCGTRGIGVLVSDTMMFQRAEPNQSDPDMGSFYGLALPLLKLGIPVEPVQLETIKTLGALDRYQLLLLTYEGQKPLLSEYHDQLTAWVKKGGMLLFVDDGSDPYNHVREWWNGNGKHATSPGDDLLKRLGVQNDIQSGPQPVGEGYIWVISASPQELQRIEAGAAQIQEAVKELLMLKNIPLEIQNYLGVQRGPYIVASVLDESISEEPLIFRGSYIDIFNPLLPWIDKRVLIPNERTLLYDIGWAKENGMKAGVLAAAARIREEQLKDNTFTFSMRGPANTTGRARVLLPGAPVLITSTPKIDMEQKWHEQSSTLWISFPNTAASVSVTILFDVQ